MCYKHRFLLRIHFMVIYIVIISIQKLIQMTVKCLIFWNNLIIWNTLVYSQTIDLISNTWKAKILVCRDCSFEILGKFQTEFWLSNRNHIRWSWAAGCQYFCDWTSRFRDIWMDNSRVWTLLANIKVKADQNHFLNMSQFLMHKIVFTLEIVGRVKLHTLLTLTVR